MVKELIELANHLDAKGFREEANLIDSLLVRTADDAGYGIGETDLWANPTEEDLKWAEEYGNAKADFMESLEVNRPAGYVDPKATPKSDEEKRFDSVNEKYNQIEEMYESGEINNEEFESAMEQLDAEFQKIDDDIRYEKWNKEIEELFEDEDFEAYYERIVQRALEKGWDLEDQLEYDASDLAEEYWNKWDDDDELDIEMFYY